VLRVDQAHTFEDRAEGIEIAVNVADGDYGRIPQLFGGIFRRARRL
jgi:hypothetical protein